MKRTTIKDLAKLLSVSTSTISRALSDHPDISDKTKERIRQTAKTFNYTTNLQARQFRKQNSNLIALILPEINMFFTPKLIEGVNKTLRDSNYSLITFLTNDSFEREQKIVEQCLAWAVEGVLISLSDKTKSLDHLAPFRNIATPCVLLDKTLENDTFPTVNIDGADASYQAINYLIQKGHQHILGVFGNPALTITKERIKGYKKALEDNKIPVSEANIITVEDSQQLDFILPPVLNHNRTLSAVFTMSDELLAKTHYHISSLGLSIPKDLSLLSISDGVFPNLIHPKITYLKHAGNKIGSKACRLLLKLLSKDEIKNASSIVLSTKLVELDSVARIN